MRKTLSLFLSLACLLFASAAMASDAPAQVRGIYLTTDYPSITVRPGTTATVSLSLNNHHVAPTRMAVHVTNVPKGWKAQLLGGGQPVGAAMPGTGDSVDLELRLTVPSDAARNPKTLTVDADGGGLHLSLPIDVALANQLPAKLTLKSKLPELKGSTQSSFSYDFTVKNESGKDMLVSLDAQVPQYFQTTFTEEYGTQELSSVPIKAGASKEITLKVQPPNTVEPGTYPIIMDVASGNAKASTTVNMQIVGQPRLALSGRNGIMSTHAEIDKATTMPLILSNTGGADASGVRISGTAPSGWTIKFSPDKVEHLAPGKTKEIEATITPSSESLAGDYMVDLQATSQGQSVDGNLRVSVVTSSMWGIIGAIIVAIAVLILVGAVARYGRR
ncbi:MAG TPA: NEW3 domain-containing protein [Burkholderiaceae bacterium]|nr:NEW3 domain-containing protein [Burkholderiaceae bacterium]